MSLHDVDVIDYIGVNVLFKRVYIGLFDDLDWHDEWPHRSALTRKIDRYIRYVRSGQLLLNYPKVRGYDIVIEYVSTHPMTSSALAFWKTRERIIGEAGYDVHIRGVDVRRSLGIAVEQPERVEAQPAEPPALNVIAATALEPMAHVSYLPPSPPKSHPRQALPLKQGLAMSLNAM